MKKQEKKEEPKMPTLNCRYGSQSFTINIKETETLAMLRLKVGEVLKMTKKTAKKLSVRVGDTPCESDRRTIKIPTAIDPKP